MKDVENYLYPFFWQHGEAHQVLTDYMEKIASSGMKGICIEARPHPEFVQAGWWRDLDLLLEQAKSQQMKVWILDDSHFPTGFANGRIKEAYPQYLKSYLDMRRYDVQGPLKGARIDLRLLKGRPWDTPDSSEKILGVYMAKRTCCETVAGDPIEAGTLTDITKQLHIKNRLLTLDVPEGAYSIFIVYVTRTGGEDSTKDYLNPLMKEATRILIDEVYEPHYARYKTHFGTTIQGFFSDEPRFGNIKGTDGYIGREDMVLPWREGLEQELAFEPKYLPLLWTAAGGAECYVRYQYMDLVTVLYSENFTQILGGWCQEHGVYYLGHTIEDNGAHARLGYGTGHYFRGQTGMDFGGIDVIGGQVVPGMNYHHDAFNTGGSNGEFYHYALAKLASSAAHLEPEKQGRAMCEAFGAYGWNEGLKMMKWIADHLLVRGINYLVPHAFNPKEFPDFDCPPHFYAHGNNPQFRYFRIFSDYVNRICKIFNDGRHPAQVGLFYPAELEWCGSYMPVEKPARELTTHQISFDIVTKDYLLKAEIKQGSYCINGQDMEVLVIPYGECMPDDMIPVLEAFTTAGVKVLFIDERPQLFVSAKKGVEFERFISQAGQDVCLETLGRTSRLKDLGTMLAEYRAVSADETQPALVVGEYEKNNKTFYMMFNEDIGLPVKAKIRLAKEGNVYAYNAFEDCLTKVKQEGDSYFLSLEPYESTIWIISKEPLVCGECRKVDMAGGSIREYPEFNTGSWDVQFADSLSYPEFKEVVPVHELCCIQTLEEWDKKAGTLRFTKDVDLILKPDQEVFLDLGEVYETAEVFVNGISAGCRICKPYRFHLTEFIKRGKNTVSIEITNALGTAIRDAISHYLMIEPFGIQGPVKMIVMERKEGEEL